MNNKLKWGLVVFFIAILGFFIARTQNETFQTIYSLLGILLIVLIALFIFVDKER
ncbi:hypothetical protein PIL02S_00503 [Paenibacillus illinoisensis]|uniref:Uncharacterized protein n=1 Tax=Paenibacillus illinoisensis TaxID=59845 RepID=A0A2W0CE04_9BACL|nr:hypothetical protein PIL02S_00503 [Paenibacillus illinoisensis]